MSQRVRETVGLVPRAGQGWAALGGLLLALAFGIMFGTYDNEAAGGYRAGTGWLVPIFWISWPAAIICVAVPAAQDSPDGLQRQVAAQGAGVGLGCVAFLLLGASLGWDLRGADVDTAVIGFAVGIVLLAGVQFIVSTVMSRVRARGTEAEAR